MEMLAPAIEAPANEGMTAEVRATQTLYALKDKDTFIVADQFGDISGQGDGLFHNDTRILSHLRLTLGGHAPSLLSAAVAHDNVFFTCNGANQALPYPGGPMGPPGVLHIERKRFLWGERLYERIRCVNYSRDVVMLPLALEFDADFRDMFEVRGARRAKRGIKGPPHVDGRRVAFSYMGLDGVERSSFIAFSDAPFRLGPNKAEFMFTLQAEGVTELYVEIGVVRRSYAKP